MTTKQEHIATLESVSNALGKMVYELRSSTQPDTADDVKDGPRLILAQLVKKCQNAQRKFSLGSTSVQAQPDSVVNDLLYVSAIMDYLHDRVSAAKGADMEDIVRQLKSKDNEISALKVTLADIHKVMLAYGTVPSEAPVPQVALATYAEAFSEQT